MDRRKFLKTLSIGGVLTAVAPRLILPEPTTSVAVPNRTIHLPPRGGWWHRVDLLESHFTYGSLHTAYPPTTANEISGRTYARQQLTWTPARQGSAALTGTLPTWDVTTGTTVACWGVWDADADGELLVAVPLDTAEIFGGECTYTLTSGRVWLEA